MQSTLAKHEQLQSAAFIHSIQSRKRAIQKKKQQDKFLSLIATFTKEDPGQSCLVPRYTGYKTELPGFLNSNIIYKYDQLIAVQTICGFVFYKIIS